mmetsp:Transcript_8169/g.24042  ORF Transcript_8169/g.24042 Transcript_8169/m.24042 type:complete len:242 (+) Transcript_8169:86-811(+)
MQPQPVGDGLPRQPGADRGVHPRGQGGRVHLPHRAGARGDGLLVRGLVPRGGHACARVGVASRAARLRPHRRHPLRHRHAGDAPERLVQLPRRAAQPARGGRAAKGVPRQRRQLPRDAVLHALVHRPHLSWLRRSRAVLPAAHRPRVDRPADSANRRSTPPSPLRLARSSSRRSRRTSPSLWTASRSSRTAPAHTTSSASCRRGSISCAARPQRRAASTSTPTKRAATAGGCTSTAARWRG